MSRLIPLLAVVAWPCLAHAQRVEAGDIAIYGGVGVAADLGASRLAASDAYMPVDVGVRYNPSSIVGIVGEVAFGISDGTLPLRFRAGASFHIPELELPLQPYVKVQFSATQLFRVLGADLTALGVRAGVGADYFLTDDIGAGVEAAADLSTTLGQTPSFYWVLELVALVSYTF